MTRKVQMPQAESLEGLSPAITVELLAAGVGDAIVVLAHSQPRDFVMLIDAGAGNVEPIRRRLERLPKDEGGLRRLDLLVVSHIDSDHIKNVVDLLADDDLALTVGDIWFNGYPETAPDVRLESARQSNALTNFLARADPSRFPHNVAFPDGVVCAPGDWGAAPTSLLEPPPTSATGSFLEIPTGLVGRASPSITVLGPLPQDLRHLRDTWPTAHQLDDVVDAFDPDDEAILQSETPIDVARLAALPFVTRDTPANVASIALLVEHRGRGVLLLADAHPYVYEPALRGLALARGIAPRVDAIKVAHHGSRHNTTDWLKTLGATHYLFSTDGGGTHGHPHDEVLARLVLGATTPSNLHFNYSHRCGLRWAQYAHGAPTELVVHLPTSGAEGLTLTLHADPG